MDKPTLYSEFFIMISSLQISHTLKNINGNIYFTRFKDKAKIKNEKPLI
jgi:hypothetical protein